MPCGTKSNKYTYIRLIAFGRVSEEIGAAYRGLIFEFNYFSRA